MYISQDAIQKRPHIALLAHRFMRQWTTNMGHLGKRRLRLLLSNASRPRPYTTDIPGQCVPTPTVHYGHTRDSVSRPRPYTTDIPGQCVPTPTVHYGHTRTVRPDPDRTLRTYPDSASRPRPYTTDIPGQCVSTPTVHYGRVPGAVRTRPRPYTMDMGRSSASRPRPYTTVGSEPYPLIPYPPERQTHTASKL